MRPQPQPPVVSAGVPTRWRRGSYTPGTWPREGRVGASTSSPIAGPAGTRNRTHRRPAGLGKGGAGLPGPWHPQGQALSMRMARSPRSCPWTGSGHAALRHRAPGPVSVCGHLPAQAVWSSQPGSVPLSEGTGCPLVVMHLKVKSEMVQRGQAAGPRSWTLARPCQAPTASGQGPCPAQQPHQHQRPCDPGPPLVPALWDSPRCSSTRMLYLSFPSCCHRV